MPRTRSMDHAKRAKQAFLVGVALFAFGALGELLGHAFGELPGWEQALFFDAEVLGVLIALVVPIVVGVVLPLTE